MNKVELQAGEVSVVLHSNCRPIELLMEEAEHEIQFLEGKRGLRSEMPSENIKNPE